MTNQPDDLVEELLALYQNMQFGHIPAFKIMESVARAAATIKELKAEVEILQCLVSGGLYSKRKAAEDRAAKAEEALRRIASEPEIGWGCVGLVHIAREALAEEKA